MARAKCDFNCFECTYDDCYVGGITSSERIEIKRRDDSMFGSGTVHQCKKANRSRRNKARFI